MNQLARQSPVAYMAPAWGALIGTAFVIAVYLTAVVVMFTGR